VRNLIERLMARRVLLILVCLAVLAAAFGAGYRYSLDSVAARYDTAIVLHADIVRTVTRPGRVVTALDDVLRLGVGGTVTEVFVRPGDQVAKGQALLRLDNSTVRIAAEQAQVSLDLARLKLDDLLAQSEALSVTASVSGTVARVIPQAGDAVARGSVVAVIEDAGRMIVEVDLPEHLAPGLRVGLAAEVSVPSEPGKAIRGRVIEVGGAMRVVAGKTSIPVTVEFINPGHVRSGSTVTVTVAVPEIVRPRDGYVSLHNSLILQALDNAVIGRWLVAEGQTVTAGQVLMELEHPALVVQRDQAELAMNNAKKRYDDVKRFYLEDDPLVEVQRLAYLAAKVTYDDLDARVKALTVKAPQPGTVIGLAGPIGRRVGVGEVLVQVIPSDSLQVTVPMPVAELSLLGPETALTVDLPQLGVYGLPGQILLKKLPPSGSGNGELIVGVERRLTALPGSVARVHLGLGTETATASGQAEAQQEHRLVAGASGTVAAIHVLPGAKVEAGTPLATLTNESLARAGDPGPQLVEAMLSVRAAELAAEQRIADGQALVLRAPRPGTVMSVALQSGQMVSAGAAAVTVADPGRLDVISDVGQLDVTKLQLGQRVEVYFAAGDARVLEAELVEIGVSGQPDGNDVMYPIRLRLPAASGLLPGMSCAVDLVTDVRYDVPTVPVEAIENRFGTPAVRVVVDRDTDRQLSVAVSRQGRTWKGDVEWTYIVTGATDGVRAEVLKGLPVGTEIVLREKVRGTTCWWCGRRH